MMKALDEDQDDWGEAEDCAWVSSRTGVLVRESSLTATRMAQGMDEDEWEMLIPAQAKHEPRCLHSVRHRSHHPLEAC